MRLAAIASLVLVAGCVSSRGGRFHDPSVRVSESNRAAWNAFAEAVGTLAVDGDRALAAQLFRQVAEEHPDSRYAADSGELAPLLEQMAEEDGKWKEPDNPALLPLEERIKYNIYHLRNVQCYQMSQPGMCRVLSRMSLRPGTYNAAIQLRDIGEPALPALMAILEDRRPTRSIGYWRHFAPSRTILRYQDAAIQIINDLLPAPMYRRRTTSAYLSNESPEARARVIQSVKSWYDKSRGKTEAERKWAMVREDPGIHQSLSLLKSLAFEHGERKQVLTALREMAEQKHRFQLPLISLLMCQLGDHSRLDEVAASFFRGSYNYAVRLPDDSAAGINAKNYARRQMILYGNDEHRAKLAEHLHLADDPLSIGPGLLSELVNLATNRFGAMPANYDKSKFPMRLLVECLDFEDGWYSLSTLRREYPIRRCDGAAGAIQSLTGRDFGYSHTSNKRSKNRAIGRIREWWQRQKE